MCRLHLQGQSLSILLLFSHWHSCCNQYNQDCLVHGGRDMQKGQALAKLAIADQDTPSIHIYDARGGSSEPVSSIKPHRAPLLAMRFNSRHDTVISVDSKGKRAMLRRCCFCAVHSLLSLLHGNSAQCRKGTSQASLHALCLLHIQTSARIVCHILFRVTTAHHLLHTRRRVWSPAWRASNVSALLTGFT